MRPFHYTALAAATLLTASAAFAQSTTMGAGSDMSGQNMNSTQQMNDANNANVNARAPADMGTRSSYDSSMPADRGTASGMSGTTGGYATGAGQSSSQYGNRYNNQYGGAAIDTLNGSGHYADSARGSQLNANDTHATPQPGALNNQLFRGGN